MSNLLKEVVAAKQKKACYRCCVPHCTNKSVEENDLEFYRFPTPNIHFPHRNARRHDWLKALNLTNLDGSPWIPADKSRICSAHFLGNKKIDDPRSPSYNPTVFPSAQEKPLVNSEQILSRYKRMLKRPNQQLIISTHSKKRNIQNTLADKLQHNMTSSNMQTVDDSSHQLGAVNNNENEIPLKVDVGVQVDFLERDEILQDTFICNRYISPRTCEAETLCCAPGLKGPVKIQIITKHDKKSEREEKRESMESVAAENDKCKTGFHGISSIHKEQALIDLAGVSRETFNLFVKILLKDQSNSPALVDLRKKVSAENRVLIYLMKMKCGFTFGALGVLFQVHRTTISRIFYTLLDYFFVACRNFVKWPDKFVVQETMPSVFKEEHSNCRVIIDATEFQVEQLPSVDEKIQFFSHYKKGYRIKVVIGCTPGGFISLISSSHGGRGTDAQITVASDLLKLLEPGDEVLADKGFPQIKTILDAKGENILLVMPPFKHKDQFSPEEVDETYEIASIRIHIERIMQRLRTHKILEKLTTEMLPYIDKIIFMACVLVNLQKPIIKEKG